MPEILPLINETHLIDNDQFKKYHVRVPKFKHETVLDLRKKRGLTGTLLLHLISKSEPYTKILLPGKEIKIAYNLEINKPLFF